MVGDAPFQDFCLLSLGFIMIEFVLKALHCPRIVVGKREVVLMVDSIKIDRSQFFVYLLPFHLVLLIAVLCLGSMILEIGIARRT